MGINTAFSTTCNLRMAQALELVDNAFAPLTEEQLNWQPKPGKWSIMQCMQHLNQACEGYIDRTEQQLLKAEKENLLATAPYSITLGGRLMILAVNPESSLKVPAPGKFKPKKQTYSKTTLEDFKALLLKIQELIGQAEPYNLNALKIKSPVTSLLVLNLGDVFEVLTQHITRHLKQAQAVKDHPSFPKSEKL